MGVEIALPTDKSLSDLTYKVIQNDYSFGKSQTAYLSTSAFDKAENGACSISNAPPSKGTIPPLGFLTKTVGKYPTKNYTVDDVSGKLVKQFPSYYIAWRDPGMSCLSDVTLSKQAVSLSNNQLATALKTIIETK